MHEILMLLWTISAFVVAICLLITVHEFGHFCLARYYGVQVQVFSLGLGPKIWSYCGSSGTTFALSLIPLGGYIKMLDSRFEPLSSLQQTLAFDKQSVTRRSIILIAGPLANFLLAIVLYTIGYMWGVPTTQPVIAQVVANSPAQRAHILVNSKIDKINGHVMSSWESVRAILTHQVLNQPIILTYTPLNSAVQRTAILKEPHDLSQDDVIKTLGLIPYKSIQPQLQVAQIEANSAAAISHLKVGDILLAVNNIPITSWEKFAQFVRQHPNESVNLLIERNNEIKDIQTRFGARKLHGELVGFFGVVPQVELSKLPVIQYNFPDSIVAALSTTWSFLKLTLKSLYQLVTGHFHLEQLAGPVAIAQGAGQSAKQGVTPYLFYLGFISISIGIINLFPLPVLDGGNLFFLLIEKIKGSPLSDRVQEISLRVGVVLLLLLTTFTLINDLSHLQ